MNTKMSPGITGRDEPIIGRPEPRREDRRFLAGQGCYLDDIAVPGALAAHFLRSPHAHARIVSIDVSAALESEGVVAVFTGADLAECSVPLRIAPPIEGLEPVEFPTLPIDKVRFAGDPVVCIVATDRYRAEDAAELVVVEYEELPAVADMFAALEPGAPRVDPALPSNLVSHQSFTAGAPDAAFARADKIVKARFSQHRQTHMPLETRGILAHWDAGRAHLTVHTGTQVPHPYRTGLAARLAMSESQLTVVSPDIGGAFGQKLAVYREDVAVCVAARLLNRPVRWREDRLENLVAAAHAREDFVTTRTAVTKDGTILAIEAEIVSDFGGYCHFPANYMARVIAMLVPGPYRIENYRYDVKVALTNKCPSAPMRAPMAIASWVTEGTLDRVALELGLDRLDVRRRNMISASDLPYVTATGERYVDVTPRETLEIAADRIGYGAARERLPGTTEADAPLRGIGLCVVMETTTYGSAFYRNAGIPGSGHETAWVKVEPSGAVNASVGLMGSGQGYETTIAQTVAQGLGVRFDDVNVLLGNTDIAPYGMGSRGARGAVTGAGATMRAAGKVRDKVLTIAASLLELNAADSLRLHDGAVQRMTDGSWRETGVTLADIARIAYLDPSSLPPGVEPGLHEQASYDPPPMTFSNATHACEVEIDRRTGALRIGRYVVVDDAGTVINPVIVDGQTHGATMMGIGGAIYEQVIYDPSGQNLSGSLADYLVPTAAEAPWIEIIHNNTPNTETPEGIKGMAEGGVMGGIGAVCNAVQDALAPLGIVVDAQPLTSQRLRDLIRSAELGARN
jgi:aerobic carbon-monoxide dehydrogenase large subunit